MIRVLIADDHTIVRAGLRLIIERTAGMSVTGEAASGAEAVDLAARLQPGIVVMDIAMPGLNGIEATRRIVAANARAQVAILSMHGDAAYVLRALDAGARAYLLKDSAEADLAAALTALSAGRSFFSPAVTLLLEQEHTQWLRSQGVADSFDLLTAREREILQRIAEGASNKEIANALALSVYTVETHRAHILAKLNLHSAAELTLYAIRRGLIPLPAPL